jgi:transcriptional regulator GlxA family with amidase domain
MPRSLSAQPTLRIGLLLYPQCMPAGLFAFADLVHAANRRAGLRLFETRFIALHAGSVDCAHGESLNAAGSIHPSELDAILVPGFWAESSQQVNEAMFNNAEMIAALARLPKTVMLWSYCTGVCLLAASGKLNGQRATVTWWLADAMRKASQKVVWEIERTSIVNLRTATASGVNGYLPIAQALIEKRISTEAYRDLTKLMVLPRPERTHQAFQAMNLIQQPDRLLRKLYALAEQLSATEATVQRLAQELNVSERTLARKVVAATGLPLAAYVRRIKLNQASERLILTSASASAISAELGFSSDSSMRRMFKELTALTPLEYRQAFGRS